MNATGFIDLEYVHNALGLGDDTEFDNVISLLLEPHTILTFNILGIDETIFSTVKFYSPQFPDIELDAKTLVKQLIAAKIGCELIKKDPEYGQKLSRWKVGNTEEGYQRRVDTDVDDWCDEYWDLLLEAEAIFGTGHIQTTMRRGLRRDYYPPY